MDPTVQMGTITKQAIADFFEMHGIMHSKRVIFDVDSYTVVSYRRDENGKYLLSQDHPGEPIIDEIRYAYGD